jgi:ATP-binding cassette subfamily B (MDR/TAP) protein 8
MLTGDLINIISGALSSDNAPLTLRSLDTPAAKLLGLFSIQGSVNFVSKFPKIYLDTGLLTFLHIYAVSVLGENVAFRLRLKLFDSIMRQDMSFFDKSRSTELVQRLSNDVSDFKVTKCK